MRHTGTIVSWKDARGFGFIAPERGDDRVFVHISAFSNHGRRPMENDRVTYALKTDPRGRLQATGVMFADERPSGSGGPPRISITLVFGGAFLCFVAGSVYAGHLPPIVLIVYLLSCIAALIAYGVDKSAAKTGGWRTRESRLHLIALVGGWPGALAAQRLFRHKSRKASFQVVFWITVILNTLALAYLFTPPGETLLRSLPQQGLAELFRHVIR